MRSGCENYTGRNVNMTCMSRSSAQKRACRASFSSCTCMLISGHMVVWQSKNVISFLWSHRSDSQEATDSQEASEHG